MTTTPPFHSFRLLVGLGATLSLLPACTVEPSSDDEPSGEERSASEDGDPDAGAPAPTEHVGSGRVCGQERAPAMIVVEPTRSEQAVASGGVVRLDVENHREIEGRVTLSIGVLSEHGDASLPDRWSASIEAGVGRTTTVELPLALLNLPTAPLTLSGQITVAARVDYADDAQSAVDTALRLYFHFVDDQWRIYDEGTRDERYHGGALDPAMREWVERHPDARFGPAFIEQVSSGTDWVPPRDELDGDGAPEHDHEPGPDGPLEPRPVGGEVLATLRPELVGLDVGPTGLSSAREPSEATSTKFCFKQKTQYTDAGNGEDNWTSTSNYARAIAGTRVTVYRYGVPTNMWLGDGVGAGDPGKGCTPDLPANGSYTFRVYGYGQVQDNYVVVDSADGESTIFDVPLVKYVASGGTFNVTFDPGTAVHNVMAVASQGIYRHAGGMSGKVYDIEVHSDQSRADPNYVGDLAYIYIEDGDEQKKFIIAHELGHAVGGQATDGRLTGNDCSYDSISCPSGGSHSMVSKEWMSCAIGEGYAHFYSADIWNSHNELDCTFEYWGSGTPAIDCESGSASYPTAYMENMCDPTYDGTGNELDWLRQFWDVHTETGKPTMNQMLAWMDGAVEWGQQDGYSRLDASANGYGGSVNTNWDARKALNGIDH